MLFRSGLMHVQLRYFHGDRPGLPRNVGALVRDVNAGGLSLALHNAGKEKASFIVQGGCFGEHEITSAIITEPHGQNKTIPVNSNHLKVELDAGEGVELALEMRRFSRTPTYRAPNTKGDFPKLIVPRQMEEYCDS